MLKVIGRGAFGEVRQPEPSLHTTSFTQARLPRARRIRAKPGYRRNSESFSRLIKTLLSSAPSVFLPLLHLISPRRPSRPSPSGPGLALLCCFWDRTDLGVWDGSFAELWNVPLRYLYYRPQVGAAFTQSAHTFSCSPLLAWLMGIKGGTLVSQSLSVFSVNPVLAPLWTFLTQHQIKTRRSRFCFLSSLHPLGEKLCFTQWLFLFAEGKKKQFLRCQLKFLHCYSISLQKLN